MNALVVLKNGAGDGAGEPNTVGMSPVFSSTMLAVENAPNEQPALLNATHGSGATWPALVLAAGTVGEYTIDGCGFTVDGVFVVLLITGEVQYTNDVSGSVVPSVL